jgi:oxygen-dependent protoporphyrinogen oxidase
MMSQPHVAIIGGGISGLSAAWYLQNQASNVPLTYTLLEQSHHWGGKIRTEHVRAFDEEFVVEGGPDSFLTQKPWALQMARELGLQEQLLGTNDQARRVFVLNHGKPTPLPDGVLLIVPTEFVPFARSPLMSLVGKLRMGLDLIIPPRLDGADETLADFVRRRLGAEALDKIAEPMMSGIYNAEAERQSLLATFPRFRELEEKHGSLIKGMLASRRARQGPNGHSAPSVNSPSSVFVSLHDGMETLVSALVKGLTGDLRLGIGVQSIAQTGAAQYELVLTNGEHLRADAAIVTTPAYVTADLLRDLAPNVAAGLDRIRYVSTGTISLAFRKSEVAHPLDGFGLVIPRSEKRPINALTWTSTKFNHRAPPDCVLLRAFFGGSRNPATMNLDDETLLRVVRAELKTLIGIDAEPVFHRTFRWMQANPQYDVGHLERLGQLEAHLPSGIFLTGSAYRGVGIPDCVHQSQRVASRVVEMLSQSSAAMGLAAEIQR